MNELLRKMQMNLVIAGFSPKTHDDYLRHVKHFQKHFGKPLEHMGYDEVREFLHHAITQRKLSCSYVNQTYSAIRFFYETVLGWDWNMKQVPRVKREKTLPAVLSIDEVKAIFNVTKNIKHKAILMTTYAAGLRVGEVTRLKISDIDSKNMQILIKLGKGKKARYSLLSPANLSILRQYWRQYRPSYWLFPGKPSDKPISVRTVQQIFYDAKVLAGIQKDVSIHTLRHCFATHLLEAGTDILHIQQLLGHTSIHTTCIYLHLRRMDVLNVKSPLDLLDGDSHE
ncbi:tyrosine-type recombinase/integrase [Thermincola potens]|uniref:Integrase family protein n=1 Tax=Thermincola potens (strain JR) TaxID=635013 RepID=D5XF96_THEPJ|nr:site-specific integrase [Thermincola potens]ADG82317.1 integrase family protein [Thermincola potens JR]